MNETMMLVVTCHVSDKNILNLRTCSRSNLKLYGNNLVCQNFAVAHGDPSVHSMGSCSSTSPLSAFVLVLGCYSNMCTRKHPNNIPRTTLTELCTNCGVALFLLRFILGQNCTLTQVIKFHICVYTKALVASCTPLPMACQPAQHTSKPLRKRKASNQHWVTDIMHKDVPVGCML